MTKRKREHIRELATFENVYQLTTGLKGCWQEQVFGNRNDLTLELACGKGEYTVELARRFPLRNFIGVDIKGHRLWRGAKTAGEEKLSNAAFLRTYIDHITDYFAAGEVAEIWITFPDPYHENSKARKRLTSPFFLPRFRQILRPGGFIHLKTDDLMLFEYSCESVRNFGGTLCFETRDLYSGSLPEPLLAVKTFYETQHLAAGKTIKYLKFTL